MAAYDYRCRACGSEFEIHRPMGSQATAVRCPGGHEDVARIWSAVALGGSTGSAGPSAGPSAAGGCCGGGCCA